jgi:hypothetical protein
MTILASTRPSRKFSAELVNATLKINGTDYTVEPIPAGEFGTIAFRLVKRGSDAVYDVVRTHQGIVECDCPDYESRHRGNGLGMCKHGRALVTLGLVDAPHPFERPTPAVVEVEHPAPVVAAEPDPAPIGAHSDLPRIDGHGLSREELARVNKARNIARYEYGMACPDGPMSDVDAVGRRAAQDALRAVLRDRPAAPALPCCDASEPAPCTACVSVEPAGVDPGDVESTPESWPAWTDEDVWQANEDADERAEANAEFERFMAAEDARERAEVQRLTLPEMIEAEAARYRRMETRLGDLLAKTLADLASTARMVHAFTPHTLEARMEVLDRDHPAPGLISRDVAEGLMATSLIGHRD